MTVESTGLERLFLSSKVPLEQKVPVEKFYRVPKVIVLAGPTGSGKTALSLILAEAIGGEIISADSIQVYRGLDIGTAKATCSERDAIPHHLIDTRDVKNPFNVVDFYYEAQNCCQKILALNKVPIVVGGSGFYIHTLLYGPPPGPPSVPELRRSLEQELKLHGAEEMYRRLKEQDLKYAKMITIHDKQKIIRGLEIIRLTGMKVSDHSWTSKRVTQNYDFRCWFLHRPKSSLYRRIDNRCEKMLALGLLEEVTYLKDQGLVENRSASQAIGYRQALEFLQTKMDQEQYREFVTQFKRASRHYAKRQKTWFRKEELFHGKWLDLDLHDPETAVDIIIKDYEWG